MKKIPLILLTNYVALAVGGCGFFEQSEEPTEPAPVVVSPQPKPPQADETFENPSTTSPQVPTTDGLIPSTEPSTRRQQIQQGRNNPFAIIPVKPVIRPNPEANQGVGNNNVSTNNIAANSGATTNAVASENLCQVIPAATAASASSTVLEPSLPIPNEARGVFVSGIVQLSGTPVAIVKAPNESVSRHVKVGAALSNGQIRVKSINANSQQPYIVLEQYGLNIARAVGEPAEEPVEAPTPSIPEPEPEASGYGTVNNLVLQAVDIRDENSSNPLINGTMCNSGQETLKVSRLILQISEKDTNKIINSMEVELAATYTISPGTQAEFDGRVGAEDDSQKSELGLRGRQKGEITITLVEWS